MKVENIMKKPKYEELADSLLRKISRGVFSNGKLPSMSAIARDYSVNLQTANRAVKFLEQQGIVSCFAGKKGTVINAARATLSAAENSGSRGFSADQVFGSKMLHRLRFAHTYFNDKIQSRFKECARLFSLHYPWCEVEIIPIDSFKRIENDEIPWDTVLLAGRDIKHFIRRGTLLKLEGYAALTGLSDEAFCPGIWQNCRSGNDLYAVPFSWSVPLVSCRNGEIFSRHDLMSSFKNPGSFNLGFYSLVCLFLGEPVRQQDLQSKREKFFDLLKFIRKLCVSPDGELTFWDNPAALRDFKAEENSFLCGYYSNINCIAGQNKGRHYAALPPFAGGNNIMVSECLSVNARSRFVPESLLWLKFLQSPEGQEIFMDEPFFLPIRRSMFKRLPASLTACLDQAAADAVQPQLSSDGLYRLYSCVYPLLARCFSGELEEEKTVDLMIGYLHEQIVLDNLP